MRHVLHVVGARPNFMKVAPVCRALEGRVRQTLVHTGQHYDSQMSDVFLDQLGIPIPDVNLQVGSGSSSWQTGTIMIRLEPVLLEMHPDLVLVYGDVNSTAAAALVCSKLLLPLGHVEAGLRSHDRTMPEETNRILIDALSDLHFTPSADADRNLLAEGVLAAKVHLVGNVMIDTLRRLLPLTNPGEIRARLGVPSRFALVTLHRPSAVDDPALLRRIMLSLSRIAESLDVVFPVHPRTRERLARLDLDCCHRLKIIEPLSYLDFLALEGEATVVVTDSGGVQEETTFLGVPCLTLRENTERPVTVELGTNTLLGYDTERLVKEVGHVMNGVARPRSIPPLWDGESASRIAEIVVSHLGRAQATRKHSLAGDRS